MSRVKEIAGLQAPVDEALAELERGAELTEDMARTLAEHACGGLPAVEEWETAKRPACANGKQITLLEEVRDRTPAGTIRDYLDDALKSLKAGPEPWVKQLQVQAWFTDAFDRLQSILEGFNRYVLVGRDIARKVGVKYPSHYEFQKAVRAECKALLADLVVLANPKGDKLGIPAYATSEQYAWLQDATVLLKRAGLPTYAEGISRKGSDYFYLCTNIKAAGVFEEQDMYTWADHLDPDLDVDIPDDLAAEIVEEIQRTHAAYMEDFSERFVRLKALRQRDALVDENTVAIDETIVETD